MFETLGKAPVDGILELSRQYQCDQRNDKIDLGIGVYRDEANQIPIMRSIKAAERQLYQVQKTKTYLSPSGDPVFGEQMIDLVFGADADPDRISACQTPGGTGALRIIGELLAQARPGTSVWLPQPGWGNHEVIFAAAGLELKFYPYFDPRTGGVEVSATLDALSAARSGDTVLIHACCHNPTGADPTKAQWLQLAKFLESRELFPLIDMAYLGFGGGLEQDGFAARLIARTCQESAIAVSCSKSFTLYRDRVGAAILVGKSKSVRDIAFGQIQAVARGMYSMPPDHGAAAVRTLLGDEFLRKQWRDELEAMRTRIVRLRADLASAQRRFTHSYRRSQIERQNGMFSCLNLTPDQVRLLRDRHAIYMLDNGRINISALQSEKVEIFADALASI